MASKPSEESLKYPTYRFLDDGVISDDGIRQHTTLEITLKPNREPFKVTIGSTVLLNSGDARPPSKSNATVKRGGEFWFRLRRNLTPGYRFPHFQSEADGWLKFVHSVIVLDLDDSLEQDNSDDEDGYLQGLDPFFAKVESLWVEPESESNASKSDYLRMKFRARWYFKKEDMEGIGGSYSGDGVKSKQAFIKSLSAQDLVLGGDSDDNEVPTIVGICTVHRFEPDIDGSRATPTVNKGEYVCKWDVSIPKRGEDGFGNVFLKPYQPVVTEGESQPRVKREKPDNEENSDEAHMAKRTKIQQDDDESIQVGEDNPEGVNSANNESQSQDDSQTVNDTQEDEEESSEDSDDDEEDEDIETGAHNTEGRIRIGADHQAVVNEFKVGTNEESFIINSTPKWIPDKIEGEKLSLYLEDANAILSSSLKEKYVKSKLSMAEADLKRPLSVRTSFKVLREGDEDELLDILHRSDYNTDDALEAVKKCAENCLTKWTKEEKDQFDVGFKRFCGSLRLIAKGVPTKTCKDVVDFHYRFKIPDQFSKFQTKRKDQAKRMAAIAEAKSAEVDGMKKNKTKYVSF